MNKNSEYVTDFSYLDIDIRPSFPPFLQKYLNKIIDSASTPLARILGPILGMGLSKHGVKRYPEKIIELQDGTKLATDVYVPKNIYKKKGKAPTILVRLPYWKNSLAILGYAYAAYGYVVVMQDTRGCAHSGGFNFFLQTERDDGMATLEWISRQYWYNEKIGMLGGSYFGLTQLVLAWDNDLLTCMSPAVCSFSNLWKGHNGLKIHGLTTAIYRIMINIVSYRDDPPVRLITREIENLFLNPRYALYNEPLVKKGKYLKFSDFKGKSIDESIQILSDFYDIPKFDPSKRNFNIYFKFLEDFMKLEKDIETMPGLLDMDVNKISQPVYMLAGWYDMFLEHQLSDFLTILESNNGAVRKNSKLVIGPYGHAHKGHPEGNILKFLINFLNKGWYDYWLKEKKDAFPELELPPIKYYVIGKQIWRYTNTWPPEQIKYKNLYLHSKGNANSVKGDGKLDFTEPTEQEPEDRYTFDPMNPVITHGGRNLDLLKGAYNQKKAEKREDVLVYTTDLFEEGIELTGDFKMILYAASTAKDTDFMVKLVDVSPHGKALNIIDAGIRARFRKGEKTPEFIEPNKVEKYEINIGNMSYFIKPNHHIRIELTSSNFPRYDVNSNLAGEGGLGDYQTADQSIFHNKNFPSHLIIPVYK